MLFRQFFKHTGDESMGTETASKMAAQRDEIKKKLVEKIRGSLTEEDFKKREKETPIEWNLRLARELKDPDLKAAYQHAAEQLQKLQEECLDKNADSPETPDDPDAITLSRERALELGPTIGQKLSWKMAPILGWIADILTSTPVAILIWILPAAFLIFWMAYTGLGLTGLFTTLIAAFVHWLFVWSYKDRKPVLEWAGVGIFVTLLYCISFQGCIWGGNGILVITDSQGMIQNVHDSHQPRDMFIRSPKIFSGEDTIWIQAEKPSLQQFNRATAVTIGSITGEYRVNGRIVLDEYAIKALRGKKMPDLVQSKAELLKLLDAGYEASLKEWLDAPYTESLGKISVKKMSSLRNEFWILTDLSVPSCPAVFGADNKLASEKVTMKAPIKVGFLSGTYEVEVTKTLDPEILKSLKKGETLDLATYSNDMNNQFSLAFKELQEEVKTVSDLSEIQKLTEKKLEKLRNKYYILTEIHVINDPAGK